MIVSLIFDLSSPRSEGITATSLRLEEGRMLLSYQIKEGVMLVLSRRPSEQINIGNDITLVVLEVRANRVRIGINAPRSVAIARAELLEFTASAAAQQGDKEMLHAVGNP
jgi:carbon storage regulator CsrA